MLWLRRAESLLRRSLTALRLLRVLYRDVVSAHWSVRWSSSDGRRWNWPCSVERVRSWKRRWDVRHRSRNCCCRWLRARNAIERYRSLVWALLRIVTLRVAVCVFATLSAGCRSVPMVAAALAERGVAWIVSAFGPVHVPVLPAVIQSRVGVDWVGCEHVVHEIHARW